MQDETQNVVGVGEVPSGTVVICLVVYYNSGMGTASQPERLADISEDLIAILCQRLERNWVNPGHGPLDITVQQMGAVLWAMFPNQYDGDPHEAKAEAARLFPVETRRGLTPEAQNLSKRMSQSCVTWVDIPDDDDDDQ